MKKIVFAFLAALIVLSQSASADPSFSQNSTNSTAAGQAVLFSLLWSSTFSLTGYIFSFDNGTGTLTNDSVVTFSGSTAWSNVTKAINSTAGSVIRWQVYGIAGTNMNGSTVFSFTSTAQATDASPSVSLHHPPNESNRTNATVEFACNASDDLLLANVTLYHNASSWHANETNSSPANNTFHNFTKTLPDGNYAWNCRAVDNGTNATFAPANFSFMVDSKAPHYANNQTNTTANGSYTLFSLYWNDSVAGLSRYIFSFDNGTGSFTNDSAVAFTGAANTSNVTKYVNQTNATTIRWIVYSWDGAGSSNVSQTHSFATNASAPTGDTQAPQFQHNQTNSTIAGQAILFSLYWTDDQALANYTFSFDNGTGSFANDSVASFTGSANHSNVTKVVNSTVNIVIRWRVWANDSSNRMNASPIYNLTTTNVTSTNTAPFSIATPEITPDPTDNSTVLNCTARFADSTNSSLAYIFTWYKSNAQNTSLDSNRTGVSNNSASTTNLSVPIALLSAGSVWICSARAFDETYFSSWANSTPVEILSNTTGFITRAVISCPSTLANQAGTVTVSYYAKSKLTCSGIAMEAKSANGTNITASTLGGQKCASSKAQYAINFSAFSSGTYTVTASGGGSSSSCNIEYKAVTLLPTRVPEFHLLLLPLVAFLAILLARKSKKN